ncbi:putative RNA-binding Zn ribbon-like protein [Paraburkholderia sp. GAS199]|uniref:CGNR zinc finger domain-containing protein n=1 Tax=Paraburkholderia sp. GAS199 TaxID=3035126 RepID=UPI003D209336
MSTTHPAGKSGNGNGATVAVDADSANPRAPAAAPVDPEFYGDHPALDLLNTVVQQDGAPVDLWQSDADVLRWLARQHFYEPGEAAPRIKAGALLAAARRLRDTVRSAVNRRKARESVDIGALNGFLMEGRRHLELVADGQNGLQTRERYEANTPAQLLAPLAESAAQLLVDGDFNLVRECEHPDCTLCFYDRTKSHRRRWCSMALCGNRHKVASFRRRQQQEA